MTNEEIEKNEVLAMEQEEKRKGLEAQAWVNFSGLAHYEMLNPENQLLRKKFDKEYGND
jgi:hypothetical protein